MKIYVDYDTTLVNLIDVWLEWVKEHFHVSFRTMDINRWYFLRDTIGKKAHWFYQHFGYLSDKEKESIQPFKGAVEFIKNLQDVFGAENVCILSSTGGDVDRESKISHIKCHFPMLGEEQCKLVPHGPKHPYTKDSVLVDDYSLHVLEHVHYNDSLGFLFNYQNRFGWCRPDNFELDDGSKIADGYQTLKCFYDDVNKKKFRIVSSYEEILKELGHAS